MSYKKRSCRTDDTLHVVMFRDPEPFEIPFFHLLRQFHGTTDGIPGGTAFCYCNKIKDRKFYVFKAFFLLSIIL